MSDSRQELERTVFELPDTQEVSRLKARIAELIADIRACDECEYKNKALWLAAKLEEERVEKQSVVAPTSAGSTTKSIAVTPDE
jgi:hypothetical protein